jgi:mannose-1-phosphate guanylyltransferase
MTSIQKTELPFFAVLMAGGGGTRLWPLSRPKRPKQLLPLIGGKSLLQLSLERLQRVIPPENMYIVTNGDLAPLTRSEAAILPGENILCEPSPRNTAPAIAYTLARLRLRAPLFTMACMPSDHFIENIGQFHKLIWAARTLAESGYLVTLGVKPTFPATGYGYLEQGEPLESVNGFTAFRVQRFKEKPSLEEAQRLIDHGGHSWNSGIFFWRSDIVEAEFQRQQPGIAQALDRMSSVLGKPQEKEALAEIWKCMPAVSLDYGIMESADPVAVIPSGDLGWTDVGSWDSLVDLYQSHPELRPSETRGNRDVGSTSVTVIRERDSGRTIATVGLDGVIIVEAEDAILVCRRGKSQDVKNISQNHGV